MAEVNFDYRNTAVGIIKNKDGQLLITFNKRTNSVDKKFIDRNSYKFPQGGINPNERSEDAIVRELKEELGVYFSVVDITSKLNNYISYWFRNTNQPDFEIRLFAFLFEVDYLDEKSLEFDPVEVSEIRWVKPEEVEKLNLGVRHDAYLSILRKFNLISS